MLEGFGLVKWRLSQPGIMFRKRNLDLRMRSWTPQGADLKQHLNEREVPVGQSGAGSTVGWPGLARGQGIPLFTALRKSSVEASHAAFFASNRYERASPSKNSFSSGSIAARPLAVNSRTFA
jgi:hypothetical protein